MRRSVIAEDLKELRDQLVTLAARYVEGERSTLLLPTLDALDTLQCLAEEVPDDMRQMVESMGERYQHLWRNLVN